MSILENIIDQFKDCKLRIEPSCLGDRFLDCYINEPFAELDSQFILVVEFDYKAYEAVVPINSEWVLRNYLNNKHPEVQKQRLMEIINSNYEHVEQYFSLHKLLFSLISFTH
jgi:hypothetical protein